MFLKMNKVALQIFGSFPGIANDFTPQNPSPFKELFNSEHSNLILPKPFYFSV